jgi:hypothetical protein
MMLRSEKSCILVTVLLSLLLAPLLAASSGTAYLRFANGTEGVYVAVVPPDLFQSLEEMARDWYPEARLHPVFACSSHGEGYVWDAAECAAAGLADADRYISVSTEEIALPAGEYFLAAATRRGKFGEGYVSHHRQIQLEARKILELEIPPPPQGYDQTEGTEWEYVCAWSCPWLYVHDGNDFRKRIEIIRDLRSPELEGRQSAMLEQVRIVDGVIRIQIREELDECSFVDQVSLELPDGTILPGLPAAAAATAQGAPAALAAQDGHYHVMQQGDVVELWFDASGLAASVLEAVRVVSAGYYLPHPCDGRDRTAR